VFQKLVSHNDDIRRLVERGYAIAFDSGYMIIRDIPYLDAASQLQWAAFVTKLVAVDDKRVVQDDHQIFFSGGVPCEVNGQPVAYLGGGPHSIPLGDACKDVVVQRSFSNKPRDTGRYADFFDKIESYAARICGPAMQRYEVNPYSFRVPQEVHADSIFKLQDTLTSRAEIADLSAKFANDIIAIVGLGGTGSYVLDMLVKTPVAEIRAFDLDGFHVHNAFRSPGRLNLEDLGKSKAEVYRGRYDNFRNGLSALPKIIDSSSQADLTGVTFAFVCVDKGTSRSQVFDVLISLGIPFIDVGMGLHRAKDSSLAGMIRATYLAPGRYDEVKANTSIPLVDHPADMYRANVQIAELNALNAALAVIRFKQLRGFYRQSEAHENFLLDVSDLKLVSSG
jgi:hypothetical protein